MGKMHGQGFVEIAERCFIARYAAWDTTVGAVVGSEGVLIVDTRATNPHGVEIRDHAARIAPNVPVRWVVNTHEHFDHVLGNVAFTDAVIYAHEHAAASMVDAVERFRAHLRNSSDSADDDPDITTDMVADVLAGELRLPDQTFSSVATLDLGDRYVELFHPGRGHTAGDIVLRVPDADVVLAGDLLEESGPPAYGSDSFPHEWPVTLDLVVGLLTAATIVVPGHGAVVDRAFVEEQRADVSDVSALIRSLFVQGVPVEEALDAGGETWAFPAKGLANAVRRGYEHLYDSGATASSSPATPPPGSITLPLT